MEHFIRIIKCNDFNELEGQNEHELQIIHLNKISMLEHDPRREVFPEGAGRGGLHAYPSPSFSLLLPSYHRYLPIQLLDRLE